MKKVINWILVTSAVPLSYLFAYLIEIWFADKSYHSVYGWLITNQATRSYSFEVLTLFWIFVLGVVLTILGIARILKH